MGSNPTLSVFELITANVIAVVAFISQFGRSEIQLYHPFLPKILAKHAPVAQWIRASDYGSEGRGFESSQALF